MEKFKERHYKIIISERGIKEFHEALKIEAERYIQDKIKRKKK